MYMYIDIENEKMDDVTLEFVQSYGLKDGDLNGVMVLRSYHSTIV